MALTQYGTKFKLFRHASDNIGKDCGRACAQMVISSIVLGNKTPPAIAADPVPVTQQHLRSLETFESLHMNADGPGGWFTFPDELVKLLNSSPGLAKLSHWRIVHHDAARRGPALDRLLEDIATPLVTKGMPAILNLKTSDHWVVVSTVWLNDNLDVDTVRYVDPAGWPSPNTGEHHTYKDQCELGGSTYWMKNTPIELAQLSLAIGSTAPTTYRGDYLAIVYDDQTPRMLEFMNSVRERRTPPPRVIRDPVLGSPSSPTAAVLADLRRIANRLQLAELQAVLDTGPQAPVWIVKDIDGSTERYALASVSHSHSPHRVVAVCNPHTYQVGLFQLTNQDPNLEALVTVPQTETLWWTRNRDDNFWQPFFPYRLEADLAGPKYRRLIDNFVVV